MPKKRTRKRNKAKGHGKPDPRKGAHEHSTQSRYGGNSEACPVCGLTYGNFKTDLSYFEVWMAYFTPKDTPESEWKYTTRGVILGRWFEIKQEEWKRHKEYCEQQTEYESREEVEWIGLDDPDMSDVPF